MAADLRLRIPADAVALALASVLALLAAPSAVADASSQPPLCLTDDLGDEVCLKAPAQRVIALSPNLVELVYAVGAGDTLVGAVSYSDYPPEAEALPRVGGYDRVDNEAIVALEPDLVLAWQGGNPSVQLDQMKRLGVPLYTSDAQDFDAIAETLVRLGQLTGHESQGRAEAQTLLEGVTRLEQRYQEAAPVSVFYQVWDKPLMTVNGEHWISRSLTLCGGEPLFADSAALVPKPSIENVLAANPEVIITGGKDAADTAWHESWLRFSGLRAVEQGNLFVIDPDLVQRATPRLLEGTQRLCETLDDVRERR